MKLRLTLPAARQLEGILDHIAKRNPAGSTNVQERLQDLISLLPQNPLLGVSTMTPGLRRLIASPYPYVIFYRVGKDEIVISGVRHTARRPL